MSTRDKELWVFLPLSVVLALSVSIWAYVTAVYTDYGNDGFTIAWKVTRQVVFGLMPWLAVVGVVKRRFDVVGGVWVLTASMGYWVSPLWGQLLAGAVLASIAWGYNAALDSGPAKPQE